MATDDIDSLINKAGLDRSSLQQVLRKVAEGRAMGYSEVCIVIERGHPRRIKGPIPSEIIHPPKNSEPGSDPAQVKK